MADSMVLAVQQWLNLQFSGRDGYQAVAEDGYTGSGTMRGLIRGLQLTLNDLNTQTGAGRTPLVVDGDFGGGCYDAYSALVGALAAGRTESLYLVLNRLVQGACWCKGYSPVYFDGDFGAKTQQAIESFQQDAGLAATGTVSAVIMKGLLNTDGFKKALTGSGDIRSVQQQLNALYSATYGRGLGLVPTNGIYDRKTSTAMLYAVQKAGGAVTDGEWGNGTKACLPVLAQGSTNAAFVRILQFALCLNGFYSGSLDGVFDSAVKSAVTKFQQRMHLGADGVAGVGTWCALLVSCGDRSRTTTACDCAAKLTPETAKTLYDNGYRVVGRYLTGTYNAGGGVVKSKALDSDELDTIFAAGLRVFPIFETGGYRASYFSYAQGVIDAGIAVAAAKALGFSRSAPPNPKPVTIYFAIDFDATDNEIDSSIVLYFRGVHHRLMSSGAPFGAGVYGTRNVCQRVIDLEDENKLPYADSCFVADMSTGWSGNMGFVMPDAWAFDQYTGDTIGSGSGRIEIDRNGYSGRDTGAAAVEPDRHYTQAEMAARNARMIFINECLSPLPFFGNLPADIKAEQTVTLLNLLFMKVEFTYAETVSQGDPPAGETRSVYTVSNGSFDAGLEAQIGQATVGVELSSDERNNVLSMMHNIAVSVGNGSFEIGFVRETGFTNMKLSYTVESAQVPISSGGTTQVSATMTYSFHLDNHNLPSGSELTPETAQELLDIFETQAAAVPVILMGSAWLAVAGVTAVCMAAPAIAGVVGTISLPQLIEAIMRILGIGGGIFKKLAG